MELNHLAVICAALAGFLIGGLWYSPVLFYRAWMRANDFTEETLQQGNPAMIFGLSFLFSLIMAYNLAAFLNDPATDAVWGMTAGVLAGLGWVAMGIAIVALFERRPWKYILINGGYLVVTFAVMGLIIGAWR